MRVRDGNIRHEIALLYYLPEFKEAGFHASSIDEVILAEYSHLCMGTRAQAVLMAYCEELTKIGVSSVADVLAALVLTDIVNEEGVDGDSLPELDEREQEALSAISTLPPEKIVRAEKVFEILHTHRPHLSKRLGELSLH